jgi:DNA-binding HxlR family transcriptional regulator
MSARRYLSLSERASYRRLEDVLGCKWSAAVLAAVGRGVRRPGQLERFIPGISTKVLNERLRKLLDYRLVNRTETREPILRVEYELTATGQKLAAIIEQISDLAEEHAAAADSVPDHSSRRRSPVARGGPHRGTGILSATGRIRRGEPVGRPGVSPG